MVARVDSDRVPGSARIGSRQDGPASSDHEGRLFILNVHTRKGSVGLGPQPLPAKSAVTGMQDGVVRTHRIAGELVFRKMDAVQRVALRQRVLPYPSGST